MRKSELYEIKVREYERGLVDAKLTISERDVEDWAERLEEIQWCGEQPSVTFLMAYIYELKQMITEIGVEIVEK